ncbi:hypothetical protein E2C01_097713 [Portunus trituberculatus]|uniref:Uncharacterized protein n=1 Tax=Portunus trituberculatus TaxID=210409 RepID=A0A5B7K135_PORTR|nr:hypothetical protein [Portunus trituberculatus]
MTASFWQTVAPVIATMTSRHQLLCGHQFTSCGTLVVTVGLVRLREWRLSAMHGDC